MLHSVGPNGDYFQPYFLAVTQHPVAEPLFKCDPIPEVATMDGATLAILLVLAAQLVWFPSPVLALQ